MMEFFPDEINLPYGSYIPSARDVSSLKLKARGRAAPEGQELYSQARGI